MLFELAGREQSFSYWCKNTSFFHSMEWNLGARQCGLYVKLFQRLSEKTNRWIVNRTKFRIFFEWNLLTTCHTFELLSAAFSALEMQYQVSQKYSHQNFQSNGVVPWMSSTSDSMKMLFGQFAQRPLATENLQPNLINSNFIPAIWAATSPRRQSCLDFWLAPKKTQLSPSTHSSTSKFLMDFVCATLYNPIKSLR